MAIEVMTAMFTDTSDKSFAMERIKQITGEGGVRALGRLCLGLINLAGFAIDELSKQTQVPELELLQRFALTVHEE